LSGGGRDFFPAVAPFLAPSRAAFVGELVALQQPGKTAPKTTIELHFVIFLLAHDILFTVVSTSSHECLLECSNQTNEVD
jgi:hypothetical protein